MRVMRLLKVTFMIDLILLFIVGVLLLYLLRGVLYSLYFKIERFKKPILILLFLFSFFSGFYIYWHYYQLSVESALFYSLAQFTIDVKMPHEIAIDMSKVKGLSEHYQLIYLTALLSALTTFLTFILVFFKEWIQKGYVTYICNKGDHIIVCGLGENNRHYINSEISAGNINIVIADKFKDNPYIQYYLDKGIGTIIGDLTDEGFLSTLGFKKCRHVIVSTGDDKTNFEIVLQFDDIASRKKLKHKKIFMHLQDKYLANFHRSKGIIQNTKNLDIKIFSYHETAAISLFDKHDIDGHDRDIIDSNLPFAIAVIGMTPLAFEVIKEAILRAHLPNENHFTIYCICSDTKAFKNSLKLRHPSIDEIPNLDIIYNNWDTNELSFFKQKLWQDPSLKHIILCQKDEQQNIDIAANFSDITYLDAILTKDLKIKIHIAAFNIFEMSEKINQNNEYFKQFYIFAQADEVCSVQQIIDPLNDRIAKLIHHGYGQSFKHGEYLLHLKTEEIEEAWYKTTKLSDRISNRSQARHINVKLKALGLKKVNNQEKKDVGDLFIENQCILESKLGEDQHALSLTNNEVTEYSKELEKKDGKVLYFPQTYERLLEKLIRSEHNRWNAVHYLNGWHYDQEKNKDAKKHNCLIPLKDFKEDKVRITVLYDLYSILYLPNYLAETNQKLEAN